MPHISLTNDFPGIIGLLYHKPAIGRKIHGLAQAALRGHSSMSSGERELVAAYVSRLNDCDFCHQSHAAVASKLFQDDGSTVSCLVDGEGEAAGATPRMRALLRIAAHVQRGGREVTTDDVAQARASGASDEDIHDTVLVAGLFCFVNRYVDGLGTDTPSEPAFYDATGVFLAKHGYGAPNPIARFFTGMMVRKHTRRPSAQER